MISKFERSGEKGTIMLDGSLTIEHAAELRTVLVKALLDTDHVEIDLEKATDVDLSCLQLLCSAHRSALRSNKRLNFIGSHSAKFRELLEASGYLRSSGCKQDREQSCLWLARKFSLIETL